jgi:hypothetical protein
LMQIDTVTTEVGHQETARKTRLRILVTRSGPARGEWWTTRAGSDHSPLAREA